MRQEYREYSRQLQEKIDAVAGEQGATLLARFAEELATLESEVNERRSWRFEDDAQEFLHSALSDALARIKAFEKDQVARVEHAHRVNRGGDFNNPARNARSSNRNNQTPTNQNNDLGVRLANASSCPTRSSPRHDRAAHRDAQLRLLRRPHRLR